MDTDSADNNKQRTLFKMKDLFSKRLPDSQASAVAHFADLLFTYAPDDEMVQRPIEGLYGSTLSCWGFIEQFDGKGAKAQVFNPDLEQHGWHSNHTVIQLLMNDCPFIVDSVRMALNRLNIGIRVVQNVVLHTERDGGKLVSTVAPDKGVAESLIYLEVDRHTEADLLKRMRSELITTLKAVEVSVRDFHAMKDRVSAASKALGLAGYEKEQLLSIGYWMTTLPFLPVMK